MVLVDVHMVTDALVKFETARILQFPNAERVVSVGLLVTERYDATLVVFVSEPLGHFWLHLSIISETVRSEVLKSQQSLFVLRPVTFGVIDVFEEVAGVGVKFTPALRRVEVISQRHEVLKEEVLLVHSCYVVQNVKDGAVIEIVKVEPFETLVL